MQKINKSKLRKEAAQRVAEAFLATGKEYGCPACLFVVRSVAISEAKKLLSMGVTLSKSAYPFAHIGNMADMFLGDANKIVCEKFYPAHA